MLRIKHDSQPPGILLVLLPKLAKLYQLPLLARALQLMHLLLKSLYSPTKRMQPALERILHPERLGFLTNEDLQLCFRCVTALRARACDKRGSEAIGQIYWASVSRETMWEDMGVTSESRARKLSSRRAMLEMRCLRRAILRVSGGSWGAVQHIRALILAGPRAVYEVRLGKEM